MLKKIKKLALTALALTAVMPVAAQDILANQAPIDRKMRAVDSIQLQQLLESEMVAGSPAAKLYNDWNNVSAHRQTALPDTFRIDLRDFAMPTPSRLITSNFGARWGRQHKGLDIKVNTGDTIKAAFPGKVRIVRYEPKGYGNYVVIRHNNGLETIYGHMSKQLVAENQTVRAGQPIGLGGSTGRSTGSHLHFETRLCGTALNPALMFDFYNQDVVGDFYTFRKATYNQESLVATRLRGVGGKGGEDNTDYAKLARMQTKTTNKTAVVMPAKEQTLAMATTRSAVKESKVKAFNAKNDKAKNSKANKNVKGNKKQISTSNHKVQRGETLSAIARKHGTSVSAICKLNRISEKSVLKPGQIIKYGK